MTRLGRLMYEDGIALNVGETKLVELCLDSSASVTNVEIWRDEETKNMGVQVIDDGMIATAYFDEKGDLIGDWIV